MCARPAAWATIEAVGRHAYTAYPNASRCTRSAGALTHRLADTAADTSMGLWMLAHGVTHFEDMRLCTPMCHPAAVAVVRNECAGLCDPLRDMVASHNDTNCRSWGAWGQLQVQLPNGTRVLVQQQGRRGDGSGHNVQAGQGPGAGAGGGAGGAGAGVGGAGEGASVKPGGVGPRGAVGDGSGAGSSSEGPAGLKPSGAVRPEGWRWWESVQVREGELPYLPSHPEHTHFEAMRV